MFLSDGEFDRMFDEEERDDTFALVQSKRSGAANFSTYATNFSYTSAGAVSSMQLGNGRWESTAFNERLQPTQIALGTTPNATNLLKLNFEYGKLNWDGSTLAGTNNGNVSKQTVNTPNTGGTYGFVATQYYTYDALNRSEIASENLQPNDGSPLINGWRQHFSYDRYGNRRFIITGDSSTTTIPQGCADVVCNPQIDPNTNKLIGYTYDDAGNTKIDAQGRGFTYDAENKQTEVRDANNIVVGRYYYDGDGKRVKKVSNTETVIFVYDAGGKLIAEYSNQSSQTPQISYLTNDHLGSPRIITDGSGNVTSRRDFMPFGEEARTWYRVPTLGYAVADDVRQKFTGCERDNESDLDFAQARMYSYGYGRFTSPDPLAASANPIRPQSWNRYSYSYNNPLRYTDPSGMIVGDFYNQDGDRIGADGKNDGKVYLVTDGKEAKKIEKTKGNYTATVNSALELPSFDIRQEIGVAAVNRSNSPTADDKKGGFHEEGGVVLQTADGDVAVPAPSGAVSDPRVDTKATIDVYGGVTNEISNKATGLVTTYHIHPSGELDVSPKANNTSSGTTVFGGSVEQKSKSFVQPPSEVDKKGVGTLPTTLGYSIVVGAGSKTIFGKANGGQRVYFYNSGGIRGSMPLNKFVTIR